MSSFDNKILSTLFSLLTFRVFYVTIDLRDFNLDGIFMRGKSHIAANVSSVVILASTTTILSEVYTGVGSEPIRKGIDVTTQWFQNTGSLNPYLFAGLSCLFFLLGTLLPDIDYPYSTLGRIIYIPVKHRTWTHTIWFVILFSVFSIWFRPLIWLAVGFFLHLFWDNFSYSGVCFIYPIIKKRKHHPIKLYETSGPSEFIVLVIVIMIAVALLAVVCANGLFVCLLKQLFGYLPVLKT